MCLVLLILVILILVILLTALINYSVMSDSDFTLSTNTVRGIHSSKKRIRLTEYFKSDFNHNGVLFLRETYSSIKSENAWVDDFSCPVFFIFFSQCSNCLSR